ncbi:hypothetical protein AJ79_02778 [Helicocarpus griseus UAMH5409]|uniref:Transcription factor domain-containing protein n=1 Tax=Helicocarpus griseus UAMH5409 TaxID=1447875 RepID=A0A2B7Y143_9EURO|nr:hypothetical protein AJ79_02778 [Helicocarpus griseus UAMH5409]
MRQPTPTSDITKSHAVAPLESTTRQKDARHGTNLSANSELFVYSMVNGAKNDIENLKVTGRFMSPGSPEAVRPAVERALTDLNSALGTLRERMPGSDFDPAGAPESTVSLDDLERHIETVRYIPFSPFEPLLDAHILKALPRLLASPYVQVDPAVKVVYYCAIFFGQSCGTPVEQSTTPQTYYKCIVMARDWLRSATGTEMDVLAAMMTSWLAINNFDYHLSWRFHREACRFSGIIGLHLVDKSLSSGREDEETKEEKRRIYWYLAQTDLMFRLWYDKPPALEGPILDVRAPSVIRPTNARQLTASETVLQAVWTRAVVIILEYYDSRKTDGPIRSEGNEGRVDSCCTQIEDLLIDWDLLNVVRSMASDDLMTWFFAETVIACYSFIVFMRRKASSTGHSVHPQAVHASRVIISIIIDFSGPTVSFSGAHRVFNLLFVTFYPFCAFFTLYQKIITTPSLEECERDILSLEAVVREMARLTSMRSDFLPITNVMDALNKVSRAIHGGQQKDSEPADLLQPEPRESMNQSARVNRPPQALQAGNSKFPASDTQQLSTANDKSFFGLPFEMRSDVGLSSFGNSATAALHNQNEPGGLNGPVDFVRAIEEEFAWRNWHDNWWGMDGLGDIPTLGTGDDVPGASQEM